MGKGEKPNRPDGFPEMIRKLKMFTRSESYEVMETLNEIGKRYAFNFRNPRIAQNMSIVSTKICWYAIQKENVSYEERFFISTEGVTRTKEDAEKLGGRLIATVVVNYDAKKDIFNIVKFI